MRFNADNHSRSLDVDKAVASRSFTYSCERNRPAIRSKDRRKIVGVTESVVYDIEAIAMFARRATQPPRSEIAARSSLIAVGTSSKFKAEIAHLACFCADIMFSSATSPVGAIADCGVGIAAGCCVY